MAISLKSAASVERLRRSAEENPSSARAKFELGSALQKAGQIDEAKQLLERAIELDPSLVEAYINLGGIHFMRWNFQECVEANQRAAELDPGNLVAHYNEGLGHLYKGEARELTACFERVVALDPDHAGGHYYLAVGLNALGATRAAEANLQISQQLGFTPEPALMRAIEKALEQEQGEGVLTIEVGQDPDDSARTQQQEK